MWEYLGLTVHTFCNLFLNGSGKHYGNKIVRAYEGKKRREERRERERNKVNVTKY